MRKAKHYLLELIGILIDWKRYGNYREMSKTEALLILFGGRK